MTTWRKVRHASGKQLEKKKYLIIFILRNMREDTISMKQERMLLKKVSEKKNPLKLRI